MNSIIEAQQEFQNWQQRELFKPLTFTIKLTVSFPSTLAEWYKPIPTEWKTSEHEIPIHEINSIQAIEWGNKKGLRINYERYTKWVFVEGPLINFFD